MAPRLRLAGGRSGALERDEPAEARVSDLPPPGLTHGGSGLLRQPRVAELDGVDDFRVVRAVELHRGNRHVDLLGEGIAREGLDHRLEPRAVLEHGGTL